jgi:hypothetical protein
LHGAKYPAIVGGCSASKDVVRKPFCLLTRDCSI